MSRISVVVLARDERAVLCGLGGMGAVQLVRTPAGPETAPLPAPDRSREMIRCAQVLHRAAELRRTMAPAAPPSPLEAADMTLDQAEEDLRRIEARTAELVGRRQHLLEEWGRTAAAEQGHPAAGLPLQDIAGSPFLHYVTGTLPPGRLEQVQRNLGDEAALLPLPAAGDHPPMLVALTLRHHRAALDLALREAGFRHEELPSVRSAAAPAGIKTAPPRPGDDRAAADCAKIEAELREHAARIAGPLARIERWAAAERSLLEAEQCCPRTEGAVLLTGWSARDDVPAVEQRLREITGGRCAFEAAAPGIDEPEEEIPVLLRSPRWLRPFQGLVAGYGLPLYRELEPTLFVAISYVLMFGMMFGDVGHGALVALAGLAVRRYVRAPGARDAGLLLICAGASGALFGAVYGSYFGIEEARRFALWRDPLQGDPLGIMKIAIGFGIGMISLGMLLNIVNRMTRGDVAGAWLGHFGLLGLLFYWGALALATRYEALSARGLLPWVVWGCLVVPIAGWTLQEPLRHAFHRGRKAGPAAAPDGGGMVAGLIEAATGAFEAALAFLANTISFVRLAAYAMSHAALLMATFVLAAQVERSTGGNRVLAVVVVILGNAIALTLEGVVAAIQALRLEYYEFFGKFFTGGGRPFRPFRLEAGADA